MEGSILRAYISENIEKAQRENIPSAVSKFLDSASLSAAAALARSTAGRFIFWGGFEGAERVIMLSIPDYIESDDPLQTSLTRWERFCFAMGDLAKRRGWE